MAEDKPQISMSDIAKKLGIPTEDSKGKPPAKIIPNDPIINPTRGGIIQPHAQITHDIADSSRSTRETERFMGLPDDFQQRAPLPDDEYAEILSRLRRPDRTFPDVVQLPEGETDFTSFIREQLTALGYDQPEFVVRNVYNGRLGTAYETGTDRDKNSDLTNNAGADHEAFAMVEHGLSPYFDKDQVTYANRMNFANSDARVVLGDTGRSILVYAPEAIEFIDSVKHPGAAGTGFAMFKDRRLTPRSLLAIFSRISPHEVRGTPPFQIKDGGKTYYVK